MVFDLDFSIMFGAAIHFSKILSGGLDEGFNNAHAVLQGQISKYNDVVKVKL